MQEVVSSTSDNDRRRRLANVPVTVSVRIAEKKIDLKNVLEMTPGSLLTFNKPCTDLLDLFVNNRQFGRGEAVKIGEAFGLRITELGTKPKREPRVIDSA